MNTQNTAGCDQTLSAHSVRISFLVVAEDLEDFMHGRDCLLRQRGHQCFNTSVRLLVSQWQHPGRHHVHECHFLRTVVINVYNTLCWKETIWTHIGSDVLSVALQELGTEITVTSFKYMWSVCIVIKIPYTVGLVNSLTLTRCPVLFITH